MDLQIPSNLNNKIAELLCSPQFTGRFDAATSGINPDGQDLIELARGFSQAPISGLKVGAVAIGKSGNTYLGANLEFTGVPLHGSLHAEQSAVLNAWMHGEHAIRSLHVSEPPCGHCRQFLYELNGAAQLTIIVKGVRTSLTALMPQAFAKNRPKGQGLLDSPAKALNGVRPDASNHIQRAINAASRSYTPYSQSPEGFIIETINGELFAGRTAESIAFNPSVPAVVTALNQMNLSAQRKVAISRCTHARLATALTQSSAFSESLMQGICNVPVENVLMESAV